jgi:hypothetical protein
MASLLITYDLTSVQVCSLTYLLNFIKVQGSIFQPDKTDISFLRLVDQTLASEQLRGVDSRGTERTERVPGRL